MTSPDPPRARQTRSTGRTGPTQAARSVTGTVRPAPAASARNPFGSRAVAIESSSRSLLQPWHYWWQAHYVDCLVDAGRRELGNGATPAARFNGPDRPSAGKLASRLVTGIRLRNAFTFVNSYYDDMAWLALATHRLETLAGGNPQARAPPQRQDPRRTDAAIRFRLHRRPRRRDLLEQEAGFQKHPSHGARSPLLRPHRPAGKGPAAGGLAQRRTLSTRHRGYTSTAPGSMRPGRWWWKAPSTPTTKALYSERCWNLAAKQTWPGPQSSSGRGPAPDSACPGHRRCP